MLFTSATETKKNFLNDGHNDDFGVDVELAMIGI